MTKKELIKLLEPLDDNTKIVMFEGEGICDIEDYDFIDIAIDKEPGMFGSTYEEVFPHTRTSEKIEKVVILV